jgi:cytosine/uracil/thiamine/allantoin permease
MKTNHKKIAWGVFLEALVAIAVAFFIHQHIFTSFFDASALLFPLWKIYSFLLLITAALCFVLIRKIWFGNPQIINTFFGLTLLKMFLAIVFLTPLFLSEMENKQPDTFNFFIAYFLFLAVELYLLNALMKKL